MAGYSVFAQYYDVLTGNVDYPGRAAYFLSLLDRVGHRPVLALDLACGTGSLTLELHRRGLDIYGVDASVEMLSIAREKSAAAGADILFLCQPMQELDLYGTVDTVFCALDSLNHLAGPEELQRALDKVSFFMDPGGWFLFDVNTPYKHQSVLGDNTFVYDLPRVYCVWQNRFSPEDFRVDIRLDFFEREGRVYRRRIQRFSERAYPEERLRAMLAQAGFGKVLIFDEMSFDPPRPDSQRLMVAAQKTR